MNQTKKTILEGEKLLVKNISIVQKIDGILGANQSDLVREGIIVLLQVLRDDILDKTNKITSKLSELRKTYAIEFEKESIEANVKMDAVISNAKRYIGKEPKAASDELESLVKRWEENKDIEQEEKNEIYFSLLSHIDFIIKYKK